MTRTPAAPPARLDHLSPRVQTALRLPLCLRSVIPPALCAAVSDTESPAKVIASSSTVVVADAATPMPRKTATALRNPTQTLNTALLVAELVVRVLLFAVEDRKIH